MFQIGNGKYMNIFIRLFIILGVLSVLSIILSEPQTPEMFISVVSLVINISVITITFIIRFLRR